MAAVSDILTFGFSFLLGTSNFVLRIHRPSCAPKSCSVISELVNKQFLSGRQFFRNRKADDNEILESVFWQISGVR